MDKEIVAHIPNEILLSHRKEHIWVHSNQVGETGAYFYSELSQKQRHQYSILMHIDGI